MRSPNCSPGPGPIWWCSAPPSAARGRWPAGKTQQPGPSPLQASACACLLSCRGSSAAGRVPTRSFPDGTGPILRRFSLAPALGLGNAGMILRRVRAALHAAEPEADLPLIRVLAHHSQVYASMQAQYPADPEARCRIYLGEDGQLRHEVARGECCDTRSHVVSVATRGRTW